MNVQNRVSDLLS